MKQVFTGLMLSLCILACQSDNANYSAESEATALEFQEFYDQFHADSSYQMAHIVFPLQGLPTNADSTTVAEGGFYYQASDWKLNQAFDEATTGFKSHFKMLAPQIIEETTVDRTGRFGMVRRWAKMSDEWMLIYFTGLNVISVE